MRIGAGESGDHGAAALGRLLQRQHVGALGEDPAGGRRRIGVVRPEVELDQLEGLGAGRGGGGLGGEGGADLTGHQASTGEQRQDRGGAGDRSRAAGQAGDQREEGDAEPDRRQVGGDVEAITLPAEQARPGRRHSEDRGDEAGEAQQVHCLQAIAATRGRAKLDALARRSA